MSSSPYEASIWGHLVAMLGNEYAAAGIMGWWLGESGLFPHLNGKENYHIFYFLLILR